MKYLKNETDSTYFDLTEMPLIVNDFCIEYTSIIIGF